jgi:hypothetical protein
MPLRQADYRNILPGSERSPGRGKGAVREAGRVQRCSESSTLRKQRSPNCFRPRGSWKQLSSFIFGGLAIAWLHFCGLSSRRARSRGFTDQHRPPEKRKEK